MIKLGVQFVLGLVGNHVQGVGFVLHAQPFHGLAPDRVARAIVIAKPGDFLGIDFNFATWSL